MCSMDVEWVCVRWFFFFKQKTAYEMRISDWSSDVCSSDLQLELSGAQLETIHQTCCEVECHLHEVRGVADELGLGFLGMGFQPKWRREEMPWMPKGRYKIMREYMTR